MDLLSFFDVNLIPWVLILNLLGAELKKHKRPAWLPPIPVLLFVVSFIICSLFGWARSSGEGGKAMVQAILQYGLGNGLIITLVSTFGYDVFKGYKKKSDKEQLLRNYNFHFGKLKLIVYASASLIAAVLAFCVAFWGFHSSLFYGFAWGAEGAGFGLVIAWTVIHLINKEESPEMYQISIEGLIALVGWMIAILSTTWTVCSIGFAVMIAGVLSALGSWMSFHTIKSDILENMIDLTWMINNVRYRYVENDMSKGFSSVPLIKDGQGKALTVKEAEAAGLGAAVYDARRYLASVLEGGKIE